jgi:Dolichyl-phosphate-mannose-protein mannosyltransferase
MPIFLDYLLLSIFIIINIITVSHYGPTWDFPFHLEQGMVRMGEIAKRDGFFYNAYGWFTNMAPYLFSKLFPRTWFPASYFLFSVVVGCIGIVVFYFFIREIWGRRTAVFSAVTLFFLPRYIGHIHTNAKDVTTAIFFLIFIYCLYRFFQKTTWQNALLSLGFFICAVNTKISILQVFPLIFLWTCWEYHARYFRTKKWMRMGIVYGGLLGGLVIIPILIFVLLWPSTIQVFFDSLRHTTEELKMHPSQSPLYAFIQLVTTTPIPILLFSFVGLFVLFKEGIKKKQGIALFFGSLYIYSFLKYPLFHQPIIDDVRYFLEIYFPLALAFVLGVEMIFRRFSPYIFLLVFLFCSYLLVTYHPYEIAYNNILANNPDSDFWAASYDEVFSFVNANAGNDAIISAPFAPQLGYMLLRPDLRAGFNSRRPETSDIVIILNRPSMFPLFQVDKYFASHRPEKIFATKNDVPLSFLYVNR